MESTAAHEEKRALTKGAVKDDEKAYVTSAVENEDVVRRNLFGEETTEIQGRSSDAVHAIVAPRSMPSNRRDNAANEDAPGRSRMKQVRFDDRTYGKDVQYAVTAQAADRRCTYAPGPVNFDLTFEETATQSPLPCFQYSGSAAEFSDEEEDQ